MPMEIVGQLNFCGSERLKKDRETERGKERGEIKRLDEERKRKSVRGRERERERLLSTSLYCLVSSLLCHGFIFLSLLHSEQNTTRSRLCQVTVTIG